MEAISNKEKLPTLKGKTLVIGPSRSGKSYYASAFRELGLRVVDVDKETDLIKWRNDATGEVVQKPLHTTSEWLANNHFLARKKDVEVFIQKTDDVIVFAHFWNIMEVVQLFDRVALMNVPDTELERRLTVNRPDHASVGSDTEIQFFRDRHALRRQQATDQNIPFIDATLSPLDFYEQLCATPLLDHTGKNSSQP